MKYTLITTVFNEEKSINDFIDSLNNQSVLPDEVIIVDGGSSDNTVEIIRNRIRDDIKIKLIVDETCSKKHTVGPIARGRNRAIAEAAYENILVTDAGCVLDQNWVYYMIEAFKKEADVVSGNYVAHVSNGFQRYIADVFCPPIKFNHVKDFLPSSRSLGFKKSLFIEVGGYPESSYTAEDTLFDILLFEKTDKVIFANNAIVSWEVPSNFNEMMSKVHNYGYGEGIQGLFKGKYLFRLINVLFPVPLLLLISLRKKKLIAYPMYLAQVFGYCNGIIARNKK